MYRQFAAARPIYRITHRLHEGRTADVPCSEIPTVVSSWLAELGVRSPLVEDLARAVSADDWPAAYAIGEFRLLQFEHQIDAWCSQADPLLRGTAEDARRKLRS